MSASLLHMIFISYIFLIRSRLPLCLHLVLHRPLISRLHDERHYGCHFQYFAAYRFCGDAANELFAHFKDINFIFACAMWCLHAGTSRHTTTTLPAYTWHHSQWRQNKLQRIETLRSFDLSPCHFPTRAVAIYAAISTVTISCEPTVSNVN